MNSKILFTMALMATLTFAQEEPENNFPDEWDAEPECKADPANKEDRRAPANKCPDKPKDRTIKEVIEYDDIMKAEYKAALEDEWAKPRRAYCRMRFNPAYPTSYPYGFINLW